MTLSWLISTGLTNAALATLLALVVLVISRLVRLPALAHLLWVVVLIKLITPPTVSIPIAFNLALLSDSEGDAAQTNGLTGQAFAGPPVQSSSNALTNRLRHESVQRTVASSASRDWPTAGQKSGRRPLAATLNRYAKFATGWLPTIWLAGAAAMLALIVYRSWKFLCFLNVEGESDAALANRLAMLAGQTNLTSTPKLVVVPGAVSPLLWGVGSATRLIFPTRLARELSPLQCDALLLHELAHYSRGDQWVRIIELASQVAFWWHPIVWLACKQIEAAEEQCCDAWVVQHRCASRRTYAEALLATIDFLSDQPALLPPAASGLGDVPFLKLRLMQIMRGETAAALSPAVRLPILLTALTLLPLGLTFSAASAASSRSPMRVHEVSPRSSSLPADFGRGLDSTAAASAAEESQSPAMATRMPKIIAIRPTTLVTASAVSPNGKYRLERRKGDQVSLIHETSDFRLSMADHRILCASFTPDSRLFVTGHGDSQVRVWDSQSGGLVSALKGNTAAVCSLDVTARAAGGGHWVAAGAQDGSVLVWDLGSGEALAHLAPSGVSVSCVRWSHDSERLAISYGDFSDDDQASVVIWSPRQNVLSHQIAIPQPTAAIAWLAADSLLAADWTGEALLWWLVDDAPAQQFSLGAGGKQIVEAAHWSADCPLVPSWLISQSLSGAD